MNSVSIPFYVFRSYPTVVNVFTFASWTEYVGSKPKFVRIQRDLDLMVQSLVASTLANIHALKQEATDTEEDKGDTMSDQASLVSRILAEGPSQ